MIKKIFPICLLALVFACTKENIKPNQDASYVADEFNNEQVNDS